MAGVGWHWVVGAALVSRGYQDCIIALRALHAPC
jgi:hypothetical protein